MEDLNKLATFKVIRGSFDYLKEYQYVTLGFSCRTDFYNEEIVIKALSKLIRQYVNSLDRYFIRVLIKGTIY